MGLIRSARSAVCSSRRARFFREVPEQVVVEAERTRDLIVLQILQEPRGRDRDAVLLVGVLQQAAYGLGVLAGSLAHALCGASRGSGELRAYACVP